MCTLSVSDLLDTLDRFSQPLSSVMLCVMGKCPWDPSGLPVVQHTTDGGSASVLGSTEKVGRCHALCT